MGYIKSALEIALEKTASIQSNPVAGKSRELKNKGKKAAAHAFETKNLDDITEHLNSLSPDEKKLYIDGAVSLFSAYIQLPETKESIEKFPFIGNALDILLPNNDFIAFFGQVSQIFTQYLDDIDNLKQALSRQYEPNLRAKEAEFAQRYGQTVHLMAEQDPEFVNAFSKNLQMLKERYGNAIEEIRERLNAAVTGDNDDYV